MTLGSQMRWRVKNTQLNFCKKSNPGYTALIIAAAHDISESRHHEMKNIARRTQHFDLKAILPKSKQL